MERALVQSQQPTFVQNINEQLLRKKVKAVRLHASGDFYSKVYIQKWAAITRANPTISFWAYTRSWRIKDLQQPLRELQKQPNFTLYASTDINTQRAPQWLPAAKLVHSWQETPNKFVRCRNLMDKNIKCTDCQLCFNGLNHNIAFKEH
jgi:hypothetical protein